MATSDRLARWMYRGGHPNALAAVLNRVQAWAGSAGVWPERLATLETRGRKSGRILSFPVVIADYEGERYLVSMLGEHANWVANVRAAHGHAVLRHGRRETVHLDEIDVSARAPILQRYVQVAPGARPHIPVSPGAPMAEFEAIAARYPVFRLRRELL